MEKREDRCRVDDLLHDAPRDSLLRPDVGETVRPRAPELGHATVVGEKVLRAGLLGKGASGTRPCTSSRTHLPALTILCPREEWCVNPARAMAIDCRSCLKAARSRRPFRRCTAPVTGCQLRSISQSQVTHKEKWARLGQQTPRSAVTKMATSPDMLLLLWLFVVVVVAFVAFVVFCCFCCVLLCFVVFCCVVFFIFFCFVFFVVVFDCCGCCCVCVCVCVLLLLLFLFLLLLFQGRLSCRCA